MKKKLIISSIASIALLGSIVAGGTYALFTSETSANINVTSGTVNYTSSIENIKVYSMGREQTGLIFENGGSVSLNSETNTLTFTNITPGDKVTFDYKIVNNSNVKTLYRITPKIAPIYNQTDYNLYRNIRTTGFAGTRTTGWVAFDVPGSDTEREIVKSLEFYLPEDAGNEAQGGSVQYSIKVEAIQGNGFTEEDLLPLIIDRENKEVTIRGYNAFYEFTKYYDQNYPANATSAEIDDGNFKGYTVNLTADIDLKYGQFDTFNPIGRYKDLRPGFDQRKYIFDGTFEGNNHTISNYKTSGTSGYLVYHAGIFGATGSNAVIQNLNVNNLDVEATLWVGGLIGNAFCSTIKNVTITGNVKVKGNSYVGGLVGYGYFNVDNCKILANEGSLIEGAVSYVGGMYGFSAEGGFACTNCETRNLNVTGWTYVGGFGGNIHYGNTIDNCHVINSTVTKTIVAEDEPDGSDKYGMGGIAGIHVYEASSPITIKNSSFTGRLVNKFDLNTDWSTVHGGLLGLGREPSNPNLENLNIYENNFVNGTPITEPVSEGE